MILPLEDAVLLGYLAKDNERTNSLQSKMLDLLSLPFGETAMRLMHLEQRGAVASYGLPKTYTILPSGVSELKEYKDTLSKVYVHGLLRSI